LGGINHGHPRVGGTGHTADNAGVGGGYLNTLEYTHSPWGVPGTPIPVRALRRLAYCLVVLGAASVPLATVERYTPSADVMYGAIGAGLLLGALLTARTGQRGGVTSFLVIPSVLAFVRFGASAVPAVVFACLVASLVHGVRGKPLLVVTALEGFAFADACLLASLVAPDPVLGAIVFAICFVTLRPGLRYLSARAGLPLPTTTRTEQPGVLVPLALAPLAALPLIAGTWLGDGSLLLILAALLALLTLVREATNLATARAEAEIERDRLASASAVHQDLVHLITHELKTPLTSVRVYTQLGQRALKKDTIESLPDYLAGIAQAEQSLERLIDNLLQIGRLEQDKDVPAAEAIDVADLVRDVVAELSALSQTKQQSLTVEMSAELPPISAPRVLLRDALSNLVSNAVKYTPEGGRIVVSAQPSDGGNAVRLAVADTGFGLSEADLGRVFTKFFRSADPRVRGERGTGLGLALTQAVVARMGAHLSAVSELNHGSTFQIVFPMGSGVGTSAEQPATAGVG
jgi:signal transduction histidine kinase